MTPTIIKRPFTREEVESLVTKYSTFINVMYGSMMDVADGYMRDAIHNMKKAGIFKQQVKRMSNLALHECEKIRGIIRVNTRGCTQLYMDLLDVVQDDVRKDIQNIYYPIKQVLDKHHITHSDVKSSIEVAYSILYLATRAYDAICKVARTEHGIDINRWFLDVIPTTAFYRWEQMTTMVCNYTLTIRNEISNDKNVTAGMSILERKMTDMDLLEQRAKQALDMNPEAKNNYLRRHPEYKWNEKEQAV